ncbi:MAG: hypothetical protein GX868_18510 [Actinobacteria bacterium]|nr:hypothetical protein [Actinomycetota bacterium]
MAVVAFVVVLAARVFVPLFIPRFPLPAIVAALLIDGIDQTIFQSVTSDPLEWYQSYDKALDIYYLAIAYMSAMRNWREPVAFDIARFLYLYRLVGVALFETTQWRWLLMVFPNTFEYFFIAYELVRTRWSPFRLRPRQVALIAAAIWLFIKLPQEWWIHVARLDLTDALGDQPLLWLAVAALVGGTIVGYRALSDRLPASEWPFTVRVDDHLNVQPLEGRNQERFFSAVLAEKAVLCALIAIIFSQVIPDVRATNVELAIGVSVLVVSNTLVSQAIRRYGKVWETVLTQFLATLVINAALLWIDARFAGDRPYGLSWQTLVYVVLLSFIMAMFDRYRSSRNPHERIDVIRTLRTGEVYPPLAMRPEVLDT